MVLMADRQPTPNPFARAAEKVDMTGQALDYLVAHADEADEFLINATRQQLHRGRAAIDDALAALDGGSTGGES
jgi:hypothetical protein